MLDPKLFSLHIGFGFLSFHSTIFSSPSFPISIPIHHFFFFTDSFLGYNFINSRLNFQIRVSRFTPKAVHCCCNFRLLELLGQKGSSISVIFHQKPINKKIKIEKGQRIIGGELWAEPTTFVRNWSYHNVGCQSLLFQFL